jgi:hypothetical protein
MLLLLKLSPTQLLSIANNFDIFLLFAGRLFGFDQAFCGANRNLERHDVGVRHRGQLSYKRTKLHIPWIALRICMGIFSLGDLILKK